jgi:hypothetical protein
MGVEFEDLSFVRFGVCVNVGSRRGDFDVIYVSGNTKVRVVASRGYSRQMGNLMQS